MPKKKEPTEKLYRPGTRSFAKAVAEQVAKDTKPGQAVANEVADTVLFSVGPVAGAMGLAERGASWLARPLTIPIKKAAGAAVRKVANKMSPRARALVSGISAHVPYEKRIEINDMADPKARKKAIQKIVKEERARMKRYGKLKQEDMSNYEILQHYKLMSRETLDMWREKERKEGMTRVNQEGLDAAQILLRKLDDYERWYVDRGHMFETADFPAPGPGDIRHMNLMRNLRDMHEPMKRMAHKSPVIREIKRATYKSVGKMMDLGEKFNRWTTTPEGMVVLTGTAEKILSPENIRSAHALVPSTEEARTERLLKIHYPGVETPEQLAVKRHRLEEKIQLDRAKKFVGTYKGKDSGHGLGKM